jgi:hypothetical protein
MQSSLGESQFLLKWNYLMGWMINDLLRHRVVSKT